MEESSGRVDEALLNLEERSNDDLRALLNELYEEWTANFTLCPVLTVPADDLDFVQNHTHLDLIAGKILDKLHGKELVVFA